MKCTSIPNRIYKATKMSANTVTIDPVSVITQLAENQLTEAIVTAAKVTKKPRASKKTVEPEPEPSIVDEIRVNVESGKYAIEAAANLTRIFGRDFEPIADQIREMASKLPEDATVEVVVPSPKKEKKPRAKKEKQTEEPAMEAEVVAPKKEKKPRAKKEKTEELTVVIETKVEEEVAAPKKEKKPRAKKEKTEEPVMEAEVAAPKKEKKPRAKKEKTEEPEPEAEVVAPKKEKKPRAKKEKKPVEGSDDDSVAAIAESKKSKKVRTPRLEQDDEPVLSLVRPETSTFIDEDADFENLLEVEDPEMKGFSAEWGEELIEEELSDIEDE